MKRMIWLVVLVGVVGAGCKKKPEEGAAITGSETMGSGGSMGTPMPTGSAGSATGSAAPPANLTAEDMGKRFADCWGFWNANESDEFKTCYTSDAIAETPGLGTPAANGVDAVVASAKTLKGPIPDLKGDIQLLLVNGHKEVSVVLLSGTNTGPMKAPLTEMPATHKKMGVFIAQAFEVDDASRVKHEWDFYDMATVLGQLSPTKNHPVRAAVDKLPMPAQVVVAKDDDKEQANLATDTKLLDAFNKHDLKAFGDLLADDLKWFVAAGPSDTDKKTTLQSTDQFWKAFSDIKISPGNDRSSHWAAGDYVVTVATMEGTNDGDMPMMKMKKTGNKVQLPFVQIDKIDNGKVAATWLFFQNAALMSQLGMMPPAAHK
ncbi:MAG: hypothetical protein JWO36_7104 [Myxococcales bacterium]|nr:hypothetical protein [Myxococcales bacterium]